MNELQESLLSSMELLAQGSAAQGTKMIEAEIVSMVDEALGKYKAKYLGSLIDVFSNNPSVKYNNKDRVYILVPDGDMSKTKVIISVTTPSTMKYDMSALEDYLPISENLFKDIGEVQLRTANNSIVNADSNVKNLQVFEKEGSNNFNIMFDKYFKESKVFIFSVKIRTDIIEKQRIDGNYGLILELPFKYNLSDGKTEKTIKRYVLDVDNIVGNPYKLSEWVTQTIHIQLGESEIYDTEETPNLKVFIQDFPSKLNMTPEEVLNITPDIFIKDIAFHSYRKLTAEQQKGYYLHLQASDGNSFFGDKTNSEMSTKTITPSLLVDGRKVNLQGRKENDKVVETYRCYWFLEDASIKTTSDGYSTVGGVGWKCLNEKTNITSNEEGVEEFDYITNNYSLTALRSDVVGSRRYKCVIEVIKKTGENKEEFAESTSAIIKLEELVEPVKITLESITGSTSYAKNIATVGLRCKVTNIKADKEEEYVPLGTLSYVWNRYDKTNIYKDDNFYSVKLLEGKEQEIEFSSSIIEDFNIFTCSVYDTYVVDEKSIEQLLGTETITITTNGNMGMRAIIQNGDKLFKYDADGDSPTSGKYDGAKESKVVIKPLELKIFKEDGKEFSADEYKASKVTWKVPVDSLLKCTQTKSDNKSEDGRYYLYTPEASDSYHIDYTILNRYDYTKTDNVIFVEITYGEKDFSVATAFTFTKEGENGTNSSLYSVVITHNGEQYGQAVMKENKIYDSKFQLVYIADQTGKRWNYHDLATNTLSPLSQSTYQNSTIYGWFDIDVYRGGEKISDNSEITCTWKFLDEENFKNSENKSSLWFTLKPEEKSNKVKLLLNADSNKTWEDEKDVNTPVVPLIHIIMAQVKVKKTVGNTTEETELYAYYPIEMVRVDAIDYIKVEDKNINEEGNAITSQRFCVPTCNGGFSFVTYGSDGTTPKYDTSAGEFICVDSVFNNKEYKYNKYIWRSSSNLKPKTNTSSHKQNFIPVNIYNSDVVHNYVMAQLSFYDTNDEIANKIKEHTDKMEEAINDKTILNEYMEKILEIFNDFLNTKQKIKFWTEKDTPEKIYLSKKKELINAVSELKKQYDAIKQYCEYVNPKTKTYSREDANNAFKYQSDKEPKTETKANFSGFKTEIYKDNFNNENIIGIFFDTLRTLDENNNAKKSYYKKYNVMAKSYNAQLQKVVKIYKALFDQKLKETIQNLKDGKIKEKDLNDMQKSYGDYIDTFTSFSKMVNDFKKPELEKKLFTEVEDKFLEVQTLLKAIQIKFTNGDILSYKSLVENMNKVQDILLKYGRNTKNSLIEKENIIYSYYKKKKKAQIDLATEHNEELKELKIAQSTAESAKEQYIITYVRPIVMTYNRYELSAIGGWDGSRLYTGDNNEYLYAPQVGAGRKNSDDTFTGIVIGKRTRDSKEEVGLFGYGEGTMRDKTFKGGVQTIFLDAESGRATFGQNGRGQIIMEPNGTSTIAGWNINETSLSKEAKGIGTVSLYSDTEKTVLIDGKNRHIAFEATPDVDDDTTNKAIITYDGWFKSNHGNIGGWTIDKTTIRSAENGNKGIAIIKDGTIVGGTLLQDGDNWDVQRSKKNDKKEDVPTNYWEISNDGKAIFNHITANKSGEIAGWKIGTSTLKGITYNDKGEEQYTLTLNSNGSMSGPSWNIQNNGNATFGNITCNNVWEISGNDYIMSNNYKGGNRLSLGSTGNNNNNGLYYGPKDKDKQYNSVSNPYIFKIAGDVYANNGVFNGDIYAKGGTIAGWKIEDTRIRTANNELGSEGSMWLSSNGTGPSQNLPQTGNKVSIGDSEALNTWCIGIGKNFGVTKDGTLYAKNAKIKGSITSSTISGGSISGATITATEGNIGGWKITENSLTYGEMTGAPNLAYVSLSPTQGITFYLRSSGQFIGSETIGWQELYNVLKA